MSRLETHLRMCLILAVPLGCVACSPGGMAISSEATETAATVFKEVKDEERIKRDRVASKRLGQLSVGFNYLTVKELQPLKKAVVDAKADGKVTFDEADLILIEMERVATLRPLVHGVDAGYADQLNGVDYFEITYIQIVEHVEIETVTLAKVSKRRGWRASADQIEIGFKSKCPACKTLRKQKLDALSQEQSAMFNNAPVGIIYLSVSNPDIDIGNARIFFPKLGKDFDADSCKLAAKHMHESGKPHQSSAVCIGAR